MFQQMRLSSTTLISVCSCIILAANSVSSAGAPGLASLARTGSVAQVNLVAAKLQSQMIDIETMPPHSWTECQRWAQMNDQYQALTNQRHRPQISFARVCRILKSNYENALANMDKINLIASKALTEISQIKDKIQEAAAMDSAVASLKSGPLDELIKQLAGSPVEVAQLPTAVNEPQATPLITTVETKEHLAQLDSQLKAILWDNEQDGAFDEGQRERVKEMLNEMKDLIDHQWHDSIVDSGLLTAAEGTYNGAIKVLNKYPVVNESE